MTSQEARKVLSVYRSGSPDADDAEIADALALARQNGELGRWLDEHTAVQNTIRARFRQITVPEGLKEQIISEHKARSVIVWWRSPALLAAAAVVALLLGIGAFWLRPGADRNAPENFATYRNRMVSAVLRSYTMTLETNDPNQIRAHLAQRRAPVDYVLPAPLDRTEVAGCGVLSWQDRRVSMVCFLTGKPLGQGAKSDLFLFVVDRAALPDAPNTNTPFVQRVNKLMTASWTAGEKTYVLAMEGDEAAIRRYF